MLKKYLDNISNNNISTYVSRDREDIIIEFLINNFEIENIVKDFPVPAVPLMIINNCFFLSL